MTQGKAVAHANNDYVHVAWDYGRKIEGCVGFAVYRIAMDGDPIGVAIRVPGKAQDFDGDGDQEWPTSIDRPIMKMSWRDTFWDLRGGHRQRNPTYSYRIVPMGGSRDAPKPMDTQWHITTAPVSVSEIAGGAKVFFNRGLLATQSLNLAIRGENGRPSRLLLEKGIAKGGDFRGRLSGEMVSALTELALQAKAQGGSLYAALYECVDQELIEALEALGDKLHIIMSTNSETEEQDDPTKDDGTKTVTLYDKKNEPAHNTLLASSAELWRRYMRTGQIGHNKFVVLVDRNGKATAVATGSTNWTSSGLCTQSNNSIILRSPELAALMLEYWNELKKDTQAAGERPNQPHVGVDHKGNKELQGDALRAWCARPKPRIALGDGSIEPWFSPNTKRLLPSGKPPAEVPPDMKRVYEILEGAQQSILFLAFAPGAARSISVNSRHFIQHVARLAMARPGLFIRGAVSDPGLARDFDADVLSTTGRENAAVVSPAGVLTEAESENDVWFAEMFKFGHAVIHDKVIVVDPFSDKSVVITGSHNLGYRASHNNDENMLIIHGHKAVAAAYATHVMDVFEHYRARWYRVEQARRAALKVLAEVPEAQRKKRLAAVTRELYKPFLFQYRNNWQNLYFDKTDGHAYLERLFWVSDGAPITSTESRSGAVVVPPAPAPVAKKKAAKKAVKKTAAKKKVAKKKAARKKVARKK